LVFAAPAAYNFGGKEFLMAGFDDPLFFSEEFLGKVRVFPLPNLVLFPHVLQPLHVFEPRYRELLEDALAGDKLIAMAALAPGWENDYEGRPPLYRMACLGRITAHCRLPDGTYNVLLLGLRRVRLVRELPTSGPFREAEAELCDDVCPAYPTSKRKALRRQLREAVLSVLPALPEAEEQLDQVLGNDVPLGMLTDVIGYLLDIDLQRKQSLLAEVDVVRRAELLLCHLSDAAAELAAVHEPVLCFPPEFSTN
jgi:Lon protease-like protein